MELWIRSQDKTRLSKINSIQYGECQGAHYINGYCINEVDNIDLGIYATKERALEVLDEIQTIIRAKYAISFDNKKESFRNFSPTQCQKMIENMAVYEMPKE